MQKLFLLRLLLVSRASAFRLTFASDASDAVDAGGCPMGSAARVASSVSWCLDTLRCCIVLQYLKDDEEYRHGWHCLLYGKEIEWKTNTYQVNGESIETHIIVVTQALYTRPIVEHHITPTTWIDCLWDKCGTMLIQWSHKNHLITLYADQDL